MLNIRMGCTKDTTDAVYGLNGSNKEISAYKKYPIMPDRMAIGSVQFFINCSILEFVFI